MTAQISSLYIHISREVVKETIFTDDQDYQVFLGFLKDYFSDTNSESSRKSFTVRGRTYKGHPHRPQNFFNKIELIAYKLEPNRFDLLIKQITPGSLEKFLRALTTRYAIYFNKKHHRKGTLFNEPYQTQQIKDLSSLLGLTRNLHRNSSYSSYPEYLGQRETNWIKSQEILSIEAVSDYQTFVEVEQPVKGSNKDPSLPKPRPRIPEIFIASFIFVLFTSNGIINIIQASAASTTSLPRQVLSANPDGIVKVHRSDSSITPLPTRVLSANPEVLGEEERAIENEENLGLAEGEEVEEEKEKVEKEVKKEKVFVVIKINDNSESVNVRQGPSTSTAMIGKAKQDDRFEFIAVDDATGWYQIKLPDESIGFATGFVSPKYSVTVKEDLP